jgi:DHA1 family tetracycline resistance protein-like MFS transporter
VSFVLVTVVLDVLAIGIIVPVLPKLVESFVQGDTVRASEVYGLFGTAWAVMQFVFSPIQGALCRIGSAGARCCSPRSSAWASTTC